MTRVKTMEKGTEYQLPADSLIAQAMGPRVRPASLAEVPDDVRAQIREDALLATFHRLESSLRLLLHATTPGKEPGSVERYQQILSVWRYELEHRIQLKPDTYAGAVQRFDPTLNTAYMIDGRCDTGDLVRIRIPCWRLNDKIVVRGEAERVVEGPSGLTSESASTAASAAPEDVVGVAAAHAARLASSPTPEAPVSRSEAVAEAVAEAPAPAPRGPGLVGSSTAQEGEPLRPSGVTGALIPGSLLAVTSGRPASSARPEETRFHAAAPTDSPQIPRTLVAALEQSLDNLDFE
jgi:hypothetical protein